MSLPSWLNAFRSQPQQHSPRNQHRKLDQRRLFLEGLEERRMLTFVPAVDYPTGANPQAIVSADFNNDGRLDLATANTGDGSVSLLLGDGQGGFAAESRLSVGATPLSLAVGDFDSDGNLDLASATPYDVRVMPGDGGGSFGAPAHLSVVGSPDSVAVGDFNGDGKLDLGVTSNVYTPSYYYGYYYGYNEGYANVLLGNADGTFSAANSTYLGFDYHITALAADVNGDLSDDFVTFNYYYGTGSVLLGDSSGYLQAPTSFLYSGDYSYAVAAGDLNEDGDNDLVTADFYGNSVGVFLGDGAGGFSAPINYGTGGYPISLVLGDFTGDGNLDVATANFYSNQVAVLQGSGDGALSLPVFATVGSSPRSIAAGDFNGDGSPDAATANWSSNNVSVLINDQVWPAAPGSLSIGDVTVTEGDSGTVAAVFTVTRSGDTAGSVTVSYNTANGGALAGSDYVAASGTVTFGPGEITQTITVMVNGDLTDEWNQGFYVNLSAASSGAVITDGQAFGNIVDNDPEPTITITPIVSAKEGNNNGTKLYNFIVSLSAASEKEVRVNFATANGTATTADGDYIAKTGTLSFAPGTTSQTISVQVRGDKKRESNERFFVNLSGASNATITVAQGIGEILDDDSPGNRK